MLYLNGPSLTPYDIPFSHNTQRYKRRNDTSYHNSVATALGQKTRNFQGDAFLRA